MGEGAIYPKAWGRVHSLKIAPEWFAAVMDGRKPFEIRRNDRGFQVGDVLNLEEYDAREGHGYTGRELLRRVSFLSTYHQEPGFVVLGLIPWVPTT